MVCHKKTGRRIAPAAGLFSFYWAYFTLYRMSL